MFQSYAKKFRPVHQSIQINQEINPESIRGLQAADSAALSCSAATIIKCEFCKHRLHGIQLLVCAIMSGYLFVTIKHNAPSAQLPSGAHKQRSNFDQNTWSCWSSSEAPVAAHVPGFFPVEGRLHALAPQRALDRTEPQPAQPGVWKLHVGPEPAHLYLLSASHIHLAKGIQESLSGNLALSSLREVSTPCGCDANLSTAPTFPVW